MGPDSLVTLIAFHQLVKKSTNERDIIFHYLSFDFSGHAFQTLSVMSGTLTLLVKNRHLKKSEHPRPNHFANFTVCLLETLSNKGFSVILV